MLKAIETRYKGYRFRSRLEARWAVFFDALGLEWVYEPEGFELGDGIRYLPDFRLVDWGTFIEIKPNLPSVEELAKLFHLSRQIRGDQQIAKTQIMLCGTPGLPQISIKENTLSIGGGYVALSMSGITDDRGAPFINIESFAMTQGGTNLDIWTMYFRNMSKSPLTPVNIQGNQNLLSLTLFHGAVPRLYIGNGVKYDTPNLRSAYNAARSARFEYGETPNVPRGKPRT